MRNKLDPTVKYFACLFLSWLAGLQPAFSQVDSVQHRLGFSVNLVQSLINEMGVYTDYTLNSKWTVGLNAGYVYSDKKTKVFLLSPDQGTYPGTVWKGLVMRTNGKYYFWGLPKRYLELQFIYKLLKYRNQYFENWEKDNFNGFVRNENAYLTGFDLIWGKHYRPLTSKLNLEVFIGGGLRYRVRKYTTIESGGSAPLNFCEPLGSYTLKQTYPMIDFGFKIGFNAFVYTKQRK